MPAEHQHGHLDLRDKLARRWPNGVMLLGAILGITLFLARYAPAVPAQEPGSPRCDWSDQSYSDFYSPPDLSQFTPEQSGEILRVEHIRSFSAEEVANAADLPSSPYGAEAYRILYLSQYPINSPRAVSGLLIVPSGLPPAGGFPVIAHGHGTTGMADRCAPSQRTLGLWDLIAWVGHGYIVSATDYAGLGTPGLHPYGIGEIAAYSMLDSVRAAQSFCDASRDLISPAGDQSFLEGHSQGGHSALFAHQLWPAYAPELDVLGTVVFAPGAELRLLAQEVASNSWSALIGPLSLAMNAYSQYYGAPATLNSWLQEPFASELPDRAENQCLIGLTDWLGFEPGAVFQSSLLTAIRDEKWEALQPWTNYIDANTPGNYSSDVPVLIHQGQLDALIPAEASQRLAERLCQNGTPVELNRFAGLGHSTVVGQTRSEAVAWMDERLAGQPLERQCGQSPLPGLGRDLEPAVLSGSDVSLFTGLPVTELFAFAYQDSGWYRIPFQIDEITATGIYTDTEDGLLDDNDEIIFMAKDTGQQAPVNIPLNLTLPISNAWYEVTVTNPIDPAEKGWAYLVHSSVLSPQASVDYVDFSQLARRVEGETYTLGLPGFRPGFDYLALGGSDENILDRTKVFLDCDVPLVCPITENNLQLTANQAFVKDGPVRVVLHDGRVLAYGSMLSWTRPYMIPENLVGDVRVSTDFDEAAAGATYYSAVVPQGVNVDGMPDTVSATPVSNWWQISAPDGSLVEVTDVEAIGGTPSNYYVDDAELDTSDTGDQQHYGDSGVAVANPNESFVHRFTWYLLPDLQPNVGGTYAAYYEQPVMVAAVLRYGPESIERAYLPLVTR